MLTLLTYTSNRELRESLGALLQNQAVQFVTPFPSKADALRINWAERPHTDVLTLSRFLKDFFKLMPSGSSGPLRKSRLLLQLNNFRHLVPELRNLDYGVFKSAYQVFSDLRAYTNSPELPDEVLSDLDPDVAFLAQLFHQGCQAAGILDEHGAIFELTHYLRAPDGVRLKNDPVIVFDGFTFMTPAQISLIEALAIRHKVIIPLPHKVFKGAHPLDWPRALELAAHEIQESTVKEEKRLDACLGYYPLGSLARALVEWRSDKKSKINIVLGTKSSDLDFYQEIPFNDFVLKQDIDVTADSRALIFDRWEIEISRQAQSLPGTELLHWIERDKKIAIQSGSLERIKEIAVLDLIKNAINQVQNFLEFQPLDDFMLKLLREVTSLDAPRNSMITLNREGYQVGVFSLKNFFNVNFKEPTVLCLSSQYGPIKSDHRPFSPEIEKKLAKLGPVRRPELEFLFVEAELKELLNHPELTILCEEGLLKHDLGWKRFFEEVNLNSLELKLKLPATKPQYEFFKAPSGDVAFPDKLSASRLQDYIDCPRKYHADRIAKIIPRYDTKLELNPLVMGSVEHKIVELSWPKGEAWWGEISNIYQLATELIERQDIDKELEESIKSAAINEAVIYASNGLNFLKKIKCAIPTIEFEFEFELSGIDRLGFIDCIGRSGEIIILLDFKRSKGQNPSFGKWSDDYPKIQLWFYLNALKNSGQITAETKLAAGYLFFKDMNESWIATHPDLIAPLESVGLDCFYEWMHETALSEYALFEKQAIEKLRCDFEFLPQAKAVEICTNCALRAVCPGGVSDEVME